MSRSRHFSIPDASIRLDGMPATGRRLQLDVAPEERARIAEHLGVSEVERLAVALSAVRFRGGMRVTGKVDAVIVQPSVVSFEPVTQVIAEPVDRIFLPGGERPYAGPANAEIFVDLDGEDLPDHFEGTEADLTDLIVETLALALDPYPRLDGEQVDEIGDDDGDESPFAALGALKQDPDKG